MPIETVDPASPSSDAPAASICLRILLAVSHEDTRQVLRVVLARTGHHVFPARTILEAVEVGEQNPCDVLLCDRALSDGLGEDLLRQLRERRPIHGLVMSGFGQDDDLAHSRAAGFHTHLIKPINLTHLRQVLREIVSPAGEAPNPPPPGH